MRVTRHLSWALALALLPLVAPTADAQNLAQVYQFSPAPGADLAAAIGEHAAWREANGDPWTWEVYEVVQGEDVGDLIVRSGGHTWADFDAYEAAAFQESAGEHYASTMAPAVGELRNWIAASDTAHQQLPEDMEAIQYFQVIIWHLKPAMGQQFQESIGKFHDAITETDWPGRYTFVAPVVGTKGPQAGLVIFYEDYAAMQGPDKSFDEMMGEVYGEQAAQIFEDFADTFHAEESFLLRLRPDLSVNLGG